MSPAERKAYILGFIAGSSFQVGQWLMFGEHSSDDELRVIVAHMARTPGVVEELSRVTTQSPLATSAGDD